MWRIFDLKRQQWCSIPYPTRQGAIDEYAAHWARVSDDIFIKNFLENFDELAPEYRDQKLNEQNKISIAEQVLINSDHEEFLTNAGFEARCFEPVSDEDLIKEIIYSSINRDAFDILNGEYDPLVLSAHLLDPRNTLSLDSDVKDFLFEKINAYALNHFTELKNLIDQHVFDNGPEVEFHAEIVWTDSAYPKQLTTANALDLNFMIAGYQTMNGKYSDNHIESITITISLIKEETNHD